MFLDRFNLDFFFGSFLGFEPLATGDTDGLTGRLAQGDESSLIIDIRLTPSSMESLSSLV